MANYSTEFCVSLGHCTDAHWTWLNQEYDRTHEAYLPDPATGKQVVNPDYDDDANSFALSKHDGKVVIFSEDASDPEEVANLIQAFLKKFHPTRWVVLQCAFVCDKHRPDGFGGSVCVITAEEQHWQSTNAWADEKVTELQLAADKKL